jgi:murein DD-endopeptidase MepM/ murein hydrolase activator NlpD
MPRPYIVQKGDTLAKVAQALLGDRRLAAALADFNGLAGVRDIVVGQAIHLPERAARQRSAARARAEPAARARAAPLRTRSALPAPAPSAPSAWPAAPQGLSGIVQTFGDIREHVRDDGSASPAWEAGFIGRAKLPFRIPLSFAPAQSAGVIACHKLLVPLFEAVFADIAAQGLQGAVKTYGGGYNWRMKRGQAKPSTHSWGIAIDLNPVTNAMGTAGDMDPALVALFEGYGFVWGGRWAGANKDPMHFQYCSGY